MSKAYRKVMKFIAHSHYENIDCLLEREELQLQDTSIDFKKQRVIRSDETTSRFMFEKIRHIRQKYA